MKISGIYKNNKRSLSFEIFPPKKDTELASIDETLKVLCELNPDFISVTFGAGGSANSNRTIEIAKNIKHNFGIEPVVHLTSLHYDKPEIDEFATAMKEAGIENILALRGDRSPNAPEKNVFPHASDLISYLKSKYDFCVLGACYPECHPESSDRVNDLKGLKTKVDSGAEVLVSQL
nr:methylenetetrahydrofolate reductase [Saccharofermentans sp.]